MLRKLIGACVGLTMMGMAGTAHALLIVESGEFIGATGIDVGGTFYDVTFLDGSCIDNFTGCDESSDFDFTDIGAATTAAQALFDEFAGVGDLFDTSPGMTRGCLIVAGNCFMMIPYSVNLTTVSMAFYRNEVNLLTDITGAFTQSSTVSFTNAAYVRFTTAPEPSTLALFATGLALLAFLGWRRRVKAACTGMRMVRA